MKIVELNQIAAIGTWIKGEAASSLQELSQDFEWLSKQAVMHDLGIKAVAAYLTVLPFKLGALFSSEEELVKTLMPHHDDFIAKIERLEGKREFGIKVYYHAKQGIKHELWPEHVLQLEKEIEQSSKGKAFLLTKKLQKIKSEVISTRIHTITDKFSLDVSNECEQMNFGATNIKNLNNKEGELLLNIASLIRIENEQKFQEWISYKQEQLSNWGLEITLTGPWPPYCFS